VSEVLVVAGEPSGDRIAGLVAAALAAEGVRCAGAGGAACRAAGVDTLVDTASFTAMGLADVAARLPGVARALASLALHALRSPPRAALLVNFTELNQRLGRALRARGTKVLWCVAPQVWAWRPGRISSLRGSADRMAVILPFEERLWRDAGHDAVYVGHPGVEGEPAPRPVESPPALAVLPGSRPGEIARLAEPLIHAARRLVTSGDVASASVILAPGLPDPWCARAQRLAHASGLRAIAADPSLGAGPLLAGFSASLCASGTASLEAALAGAAPVVAYRLDPVAFALARRLVRTPHVALPNVLLGRRAFPELLQDEVSAGELVAAARGVLARRDELGRLAAELRAILAPPGPGRFGERVAALMLPWVIGVGRNWCFPSRSTRA
jgi:lipid-A-disaccharide synthase